jgi:hypothetical protein
MNPLAVSALYVAPDRTWYTDVADPQGGTTWLGKPDESDAASLPFVQLAEAQTMLILENRRQQARFSASYPSAPGRVLCERLGGGRICAILEASRCFYLMEQENLLQSWCLEVGGKRYQLNRAGYPDRVRAFHTMLVARTDITGSRLTAAVASALQEWDSRPTTEKKTLLEQYVQVLESKSESDETERSVDSILVAAARMEFDNISQQGDRA